MALSVLADAYGSRALLPGLNADDVEAMSLVQIYLDAVTHQVITREELGYLAGHHDQFDATELKLSARLETLIKTGSISVGSR